MTYRAHIEGFTSHFQTIDALKAWALGLLARYPDMRGKEVQIWKATWVGRESASYNATPSKVCILGA
jgi:hypothetical protein